nr:Na(+)/H(+) exchange regulatory cofactor NHE-RF4 [Pelodiscus sinensis]|eukprot:XP_025039736.1 Na(+)/H(+) exchange regulatory cofactor NHE-RF4 [Pelodiscus sinensis]
MKQKQGLEDTEELTLKFEFNPKDGIDNPALCLAEDSDTEGAEAPRFCLLTKGNGESFGFCLHQEVGNPGHIVRQVECGGMAQRRGLQDGDRILEVNGEYVDNMEHFRVVQKIKASGDQVAVAVLDGRAYEVAKALDKNLAELLPHRAGPRLCHVVRDKTGFGFRVSAPEGVKGTFRLAVTTGSPADRAGVPPDSWLLELNGASVRNYTYTQLTRKLKHSGGKVTLLVIDDESEELSSPSSSLALGRRRTHTAQFLSEVDAGLPADKAGMQDGDRILAVNGEDVEKLGHQEVVDRIRAGGNQVTLLVIDPEGDKFYSSMGLSPLLFSEEGPPLPTAPTCPITPQGNSAPASTPCLCLPDRGPEGRGFQQQIVTDEPEVFITEASPQQPEHQGWPNNVSLTHTPPAWLEAPDSAPLARLKL